VPQIRDDRFAYIRRQGQLGPPATLAVHAQGSGLPVNILEFKERHFAGTQTQACEQEQDRIVATPEPRYAD